MDKNTLLFKKQFGFTVPHSTIHAVLELIQKISGLLSSSTCPKHLKDLDGFKCYLTI